MGNQYSMNVAPIQLTEKRLLFCFYINILKNIPIFFLLEIAIIKSVSTLSETGRNQFKIPKKIFSLFCLEIKNEYEVNNN